MQVHILVVSLMGALVGALKSNSRSALGPGHPGWCFRVIREPQHCLRGVGSWFMRASVAPVDRGVKPKALCAKSAVVDP